jgi:aryl-alcohol dehydrogenase-like predicted oxidoreductase
VGVLTEYFIARDDRDAARAHASQTGPKRAGFKTAEWKSLDPVVTMATLHEVVTGQNALEWIKSKPPDSTVAGTDKDDHWVFRVYDQHFATLAALPDARVPDIAAKWAATEELREWPPADVRDALSELIALARDARASGAHLYCWVSL